MRNNAKQGTCPKRTIGSGCRGFAAPCHYSVIPSVPPIAAHSHSYSHSLQLTVFLGAVFLSWSLIIIDNNSQSKIWLLVVPTRPKLGHALYTLGWHGVWMRWESKEKVKASHPAIRSQDAGGRWVVACGMKVNTGGCFCLFRVNLKIRLKASSTFKHFNKRA
jgi:hypothetical protein